MMRSLRIRLILLLGIAIVAATVLQFAATFRVSMQKADTMFDYHMQQMALALQDSTFQQPGWYTSPRTEEIEDFDLVVQIWTDDGVRVYQSRRYRALPQQGTLGYSTVTLDNGDWRIYAVHTNTRVIQVAQKMDSRRNRAIVLALQSVWPIIPVALLLFVAAWWVVTSALAPLNRIGHDLAHRNADSLAPVSDQGVPKEVSLLIAELNSLLARMARALQSQQRFVADAAHELRSPLTALKLQVQTLARARDDSAREQAIGRLQGGVDRAARLLEQLLSLAREDPSAPSSQPTRVSLNTCVEMAQGDVAPLALSRQVRLSHGEIAEAEVCGDADSLRIMARNLLDNAVRYASGQGEVRIDIALHDGAPTLTIQDSGAGIPEQERSRVFDRFYRMPGTSPSGSGLGLAIVKAIADRHGATVSLGTSDLGGLAVAVRFPPVDQAPGSPVLEKAA
jgi:two-component system OmpR family sensor kinase